MDNRLKFPSTLIDFTEVGLSGQEHDYYPAPGQARYDTLRLYLIALLANQAAASAPTQYREGTLWFNNNDKSLQLAAIRTVAGAPTFDTVSKNIALEVGVTLDDWYNSVKGHLTGDNITPSIGAGVGAGVGAVGSISGSDTAGIITLTTGTTPLASTIVLIVTFGTAWATVPQLVRLDPANLNASTRTVYSDSSTLSRTAFTVNIGTVALIANTAYKWYYEAR